VTWFVTRAAVMLAGLVMAAYGGLLLAERGWQNFQAALTWLVAGVLLHDAVLAPLTVVAAWAALRVVGAERVRPWAVAVVLLGPLTLLSVPVLGRFGARRDNPTLLDRPYWAGWSVVVAVVAAAILVAEVVRRRRRPVAEEGGARGPGDGRR
jgi:hypothetical protein